VIHAIELRPPAHRDQIGEGTPAKPQLAYLGAASAKWIFHQEKSTLNTARKGYCHSGFAL
jgi:hypothetical protein